MGGGPQQAEILQGFGLTEASLKEFIAELREEQAEKESQHDDFVREAALVGESSDDEGD